MAIYFSSNKLESTTVTVEGAAIKTQPPATSAAAIKAANPSATDGLYWITPPNGTPIQVYCDMTTSDEFGNKGWMLVASWNNGSLWTMDSTSSSAVFGSTPLNCFSSNFGDFNINEFRVTATNSITNLGTNASGGDWYYYWNRAIKWKQVWSYAAGVNKNYMNDYSGDVLANRTKFGGPEPVNNGSLTTRICMRLFDYAYNIKWGYKAVTQRWNNFSDSSGGGQQSFRDFWGGLTTPGVTLGIYFYGADGTLAIIPSGSTSTTAGHDCNNNNNKVGRDDGGTSAWYGSSPTADLNAQNGITTDYPLFFWIR